MTLAAWWIAPFLLFLAPGAAPPTGRHPPVGDCHDDDMVDRCNAEQQRRVRELFGVKPIEAHRDAGDQVRRAFYVDGYGNDVVAIAFVRPKGDDPELWVHFPRERDGKRKAPLQASVPQAVWDGVIKRSDHFDRQLAPLPSAASSDEVIMCMHSWVYTVEATDPSDPGSDSATVRRRTEDACDDGLTEAYAAELPRAAVPLLPPCARLDPSQHRNEASLLSACRLLSGDRLAAAAVLNRVRPFQHIRTAADAVHLEGLFHYQATVDWNGERNAGDGSAAKFWTDKVVTSEGADFYYEAIDGKSPNQVRLSGWLIRWVDVPEGKDSVYERARVEQVWTDEQGDFAIRSVTVGPFKRQSER
ncbi:MAG TPA: hypothetical protein VGW34_06795 [Allosphingosinicella sp.]|nr:hypothetical protein [Allosphingosinicella sp.]